MKTAFLLLLLLSLSAQAQQSASNPHASPADADVGRGTFRIYCSPCHGIRAGGGRGPDLTLGVYSAGDSDADLFEVIAKGVPGTEMPGYEWTMSGEAVWRVVAYLRSIARHEPAEIPGDPRAGEKIYGEKGACAGCHAIRGEGGRLGPDLTRVGRMRSLAYLRESIVDPGADISVGFKTLRVVLSDGGTITGVEKNFDNFSAQLLDEQGGYRSFLREDVREISREARSLMPSYAEALTKAEIDHLVSYLAGLRGEEGKP